MANFVFNIARGRMKELFGLPAASDAIIAVLCKTAEADATLADYDDLSALLAGTTDECDATDYVRKTITSGITITVDDANNRTDIDIGDITWTGIGGATNNTLAALLLCYDNDTGAGTDANIIPLLKWDFVYTTADIDLVAVFNASGIWRSQ